MTEWTCPCCGASSAVRLTPDEVARVLTSPVLAQVVRALAQRPMTYEELIFSVYGGAEPEHARQAIASAVLRYGPQVERFGWRIVRPGAGSRGPLHLSPIRSEVAA